MSEAEDWFAVLGKKALLDFFLVSVMPFIVEHMYILLGYHILFVHSPSSLISYVLICSELISLLRYVKIKLICLTVFRDTAFPIYHLLLIFSSKIKLTFVKGCFDLSLKRVVKSN